MNDLDEFFQGLVETEKIKIGKIYLIKDNDVLQELIKKTGAKTAVGQPRHYPAVVSYHEKYMCEQKVLLMHVLDIETYIPSTEEIHTCCGGEEYKVGDSCRHCGDKG